MTGPPSSRREHQNQTAIRRLQEAADRLPPGVLEHAGGQRIVPALPRHAVDSYWRAHLLRADRLARALAARSGSPKGWSWQAGPQAFRLPPSPFREPGHARGPGSCCICGQPVFALGWHVDYTGQGGCNRRALWHACCVAAWSLWTAPTRFRVALGRMQKRRCAETGRRLLRSAEVDHRVPLFQVWRERRDMPWPDLLSFWGLPNLQVLSREAHRAKSSLEAARRGRTASAGLDSSATRFERDVLRSTRSVDLIL